MVASDGSQVFTYRRPDDMWLTYVRNSYFSGYVPEYEYDNNDERRARLIHNDELQYIKNGNTHWEVVMQLLEPQFNVVTM